MFRNAWWTVMVLAATCVLQGCVLPDQMTTLQKDVSDLQSEIRRLEAEQREANRRLEGIAEELSREGDTIGRGEFADVRLRLDEISRQGTVLDERLVEFNHRMDRLSQGVQENRELIRQVSSTTTLLPPVMPGQATGEGDPARANPVTAGMPPRSSPLPSAESLYNSSYADFSKGSYALAISGFEEYAGRYPDSDLADNALYWIGECYFSQGNYDVALEAFDRMLARYPSSDRSAAANLKKGLAYLEQNQVGQAIVQLQFVEDEHPATDEARIARDKLTSLGVDR